MKIKKIKKILVIVVMFTIVAVGIIVMRNNEFNPNYSVAIIETTQSKNITHITYYNDDMKIVYSHSIPYSEACDAAFGLIPRLENNIYMAPTDGDYEGKNDVVVISAESGEVTILEDLPDEVDLDKNIAVDDKQIYVNSNLNYKSYLYAMTHDGEKAGYVSEPDAIFGDMVTDGNSLYVSSLSDDCTETTLIKYNCDNLKCENKHLLKKNDASYPLILNDKIYFISNCDDKVSLGVIDKDFNNEKYIEYEIAGNIYGSSNIVKYENTLYFMLYEESKDCILCSYNLSTGKSSLQTLKERNIFQLECKDNSMYALSYDIEAEEGYLYKYSMDTGKAVCENSWDIYSKKHSQTNFYVSGFFLR